MAEFDDYADDYADALQQGLKYSGEDATYFATARVRWLARRLKKLRFAPRSLLDFGCGNGASYPDLPLNAECRSRSPVSMSPIACSKVARREHGSPRATFVLRTDYEPRGQADIAFCNGVFHHIPPSERADALDFVSRALRPGGLFAFWENNPWNPATRFVMSRIPFDRDAITISPPEARHLLAQGRF